MRQKSDRGDHQIRLLAQETVPITHHPVQVWWTGPRCSPLAFFLRIDAARAETDDNVKVDIIGFNKEGNLQRKENMGNKVKLEIMSHQELIFLPKNTRASAWTPSSGLSDISAAL